MSIQTLEALDHFDGEEVDYYYDSHPTEEDLMGDSIAQDRVTKYLVEVFEWLYASQGWLIARNLNLYISGYWKEYPRTPDISVFKGVSLTPADWWPLRSWRIRPPEKPAPAVVFEIVSDETANNDLVEKPVDYAGIGIREYFCPDPRPNGKKSRERLRGWRYTGGSTEVIKGDRRGRMWSEELESWLVPDGLVLRLTDAGGNLRLTKAEAEELEKERERREKEGARRETAQARREADRERDEKRAALERERQAEERERLAREDAVKARDEAARERAENERLHALLRSLGRDAAVDGVGGEPVE